MSMQSMLRKLAVTFLTLLSLVNQVYAGNAMHIVINDHLGTPQMLVDENRNVVWQAEYDEFGKANILVQQAEFNQRFPGQYYDKETGLHYNYYRDYDPSLGRYVQSDPIGIMRDYSDPQMQVAVQQGAPLIGAKGTFSELNHTYGYVDNDPLSFVDFFGLAGGRYTKKCGRCLLIYDSDQFKGAHTHWQCPGQPQGCIRKDGTTCDGSPPPPPEIKKCLEDNGRIPDNFSVCPPETDPFPWWLLLMIRAAPAAVLAW